MGEVSSDVERFTAFYRTHYEPVLRYSQRRAAEQDAHDATSEVFAIAWRRVSVLPDDALPWLIGTARRVLANQRRGNLRREALALRLLVERPVEGPSLPEQVELQQRWAAALGALSFADQEVLALLAWDGLSVAEAAASLACSRSAFAMRLSRARRRLQRALAAQSSDPAGLTTATATATATARDGELR